MDFSYTPSPERLARDCGLEGQANDLTTPLTPEKFKPFISEKKADPSQVLADAYSIEFLQIHHCNQQWCN